MDRKRYPRSKKFTILKNGKMFWDNANHGLMEGYKVGYDKRFRLGVKVPVKGGENKVLYVWLDAPIGYISATKKWAKQENKNGKITGKP